MNIGFDEGKVIKKGEESAIDCIKLNIDHSGVISSTHYHDYIELLYGRDCDITVWVNDKTIHFTTGDLVIINPHETHTLYSHKKKSDYIVIKFIPEILSYGNQMPAEMMYILPAMYNASISEHIIKKYEYPSSSVSEIVNEIYREWCDEKFGYELAIRSGILKLFLYVVRHLDSKYEKSLFSESDEMTTIIYKAAEYCSSHCCDVTAKQISEMYSVSYSYFSRTFKKIMGRTFSQYLNDVRIDNARKMLLTSSASMSEIATDTGFSSASHFIHNFKKKTGFSPLAYKSKFKEKYQ